MIGSIKFTPIDVDQTIRTVYGEARSEPVEGQVGVIWTIRTRATWGEPLPPDHPEHEWWGNTPAEACRHPLQYSSWNANNPNLPKMLALSMADPEYVKLEQLVRGVFNGQIRDPSHGATTYKVTGTKASWDHAVDSVNPIVLGHQSFWRLSPHGPVLPFLDYEEPRNPMTDPSPPPAPPAPPATILHDVTQDEAAWAYPVAPVSAKFDWNVGLKYLAGFGLAGSVLVLAILGKVDPQFYVATIALPGLAAIGVHAATKSGR